MEILKKEYSEEYYLEYSMEYSLEYSMEYSLEYSLEYSIWVDQSGANIWQAQMSPRGLGLVWQNYVRLGRIEPVTSSGLTK